MLAWRSILLTTYFSLVTQPALGERPGWYGDEIVSVGLAGTVFASVPYLSAIGGYTSPFQEKSLFEKGMIVVGASAALFGPTAVHLSHHQLVRAKRSFIFNAALPLTLLSGSLLSKTDDARKFLNVSAGGIWALYFVFDFLTASESCGNDPNTCPEEKAFAIGFDISY